MEAMRIGVLSDTHAYYFEDIPREMLKRLQETDIVVHLGDFTNTDVYEGFKEVFGKKFKAVAGNTDLPDLKRRLPKKVEFEAGGVKIGAIHPYWGGPPEGIEEKIRREFPDARVILYGHTHRPKVEEINGILFVNPGQGYPLYTVKASIAIVTVSDKIDAEIVYLG